MVPYQLFELNIVCQEDVWGDTGTVWACGVKRALDGVVCWEQNSRAESKISKDGILYRVWDGMNHCDGERAVNRRLFDRSFH